MNFPQPFLMFSQPISLRTDTGTAGGYRSDHQDLSPTQVFAVQKLLAAPVGRDNEPRVQPWGKKVRVRNNALKGVI